MSEVTGARTAAPQPATHPRARRAAIVLLVVAAFLLVAALSQLAEHGSAVVGAGFAVAGAITLGLARHAWVRRS
jgi:hypothetical protein